MVFGRAQCLMRMNSIYCLVFCLLFYNKANLNEWYEYFGYRKTCLIWFKPNCRINGTWKVWFSPLCQFIKHFNLTIEHLSFLMKSTRHLHEKPTDKDSRKISRNKQAFWTTIFRKIIIKYLKPSKPSKLSILEV